MTEQKIKIKLKFENLKYDDKEENRENVKQVFLQQLAEEPLSIIEIEK